VSWWATAGAGIAFFDLFKSERGIEKNEANDKANAFARVVYIK
jgi:hypothetical protein